MKKLAIAFVMAVIAISLFIAPPQAVTFGISGYSWAGTAKTGSDVLVVPHPSATASKSAVWQTFYSSYNDTLLNSITVLIYETGSCNAYYMMALYNATGAVGSSTPQTLIETSTTEFNPTSIAALAGTWVTFTFSNTTTLYSNVLYSWVYYEKNETTADNSNYAAICYGTAGIAAEYYNGDFGYWHTSGWQSENNAWHTIFNLETSGGVYTEYVGGNYYYDTVSVTTSTPTQDIMFYTLLVLTFACIILMLRSGIPLVNFVFGTMTLGIAAYSLTNPDIIFFGYIQMFAMLMATLCMLLGYRSYRND